MIISNSVSLNIETKLEKGADLMKIIMCIIGMMAGAVLLEQVVNATKIMRVEDRKIEFNCLQYVRSTWEVRFLPAPPKTKGETIDS